MKPVRHRPAILQQRITDKDLRGRLRVDLAVIHPAALQLQAVQQNAFQRQDAAGRLIP